jgi:hypothetical protein
MPAKKARDISKILEDYKTKDGKYIFLWGASDQAPGVKYSGPTYHSTKYNDPMHFAIAPGVTTKDLMKVRRSMRLKLSGRVKKAKK